MESSWEEFVSWHAQAVMNAALRSGAPKCPHSTDSLWFLCIYVLVIVEIWYFGSTGRTKRFAMRPTMSSPAMMYMVEL